MLDDHSGDGRDGQPTLLRLRSGRAASVFAVLWVGVFRESLSVIEVVAVPTLPWLLIFGHLSFPCLCGEEGPCRTEVYIPIQILSHGSALFSAPWASAPPSFPCPGTLNTVVTLCAELGTVACGRAPNASFFPTVPLR